MKKNMLFSFLLFTIWAKGQSTFKTESISIFKDGSSFVQKNGTVNTNNATFSFKGDNIPQALFGTFWVSSSKSKINEVLSYMDTIRKSTTAPSQNILEILDAMKGKTVAIKIQFQQQIFEGKIVDIGYQENSSVYSESSNLFITKTPSFIHFLTKENRHKYLMAKDIESIETNDDVRPTFTKTAEKLTPTLDIIFDNNKPTQDLKLMYLQKGITWSPFYNLELQDNGKAVLKLNSEISNNAEPINYCDINFVVGVPNFKYATSLTELVNFENLITSENRNDNNVSQANTYSLNYSNLTTSNFNVATVGNSNFENNLEAENVQDLYFYNLKNVSLRQGGRAHYELFNSEVNYEHIYEVELIANKEDYQYGTDFITDSKNQNLVYHGIKIKNNTNNPFTAAPVLLTEKKGDRLLPIAQDLLSYTPMQASSVIRLTSTSDIQATQAEKQKSSTSKFKKWNGKIWDLVNVESKVTVKNYKKTACKIIIKRYIMGDLIKSSIDWDKAQLNAVSGSLDFLNKVEWTVTLNPGEEKVITYSYNYYRGTEE